MNIGLTGGSGFVGRRLTEHLYREGHRVRTTSTRDGSPRTQDLAGCDAVVHLAGEPVAQRWNAGVKKRIRDSRIDGTRSLVEAMRASPPKVMVSASAIGYYGSRGDEILTENSAPANDFLAEVAQGWERE